MKLDHIAIVRLSALGDIVNSTIVLQFIHQKYPDIKIDWITEEVFAPLLDEHPFIYKVHTINLKKIKKEKSFSLLKKTVSKLKNLPKYDLIIDMQGLLKSALVSRFIGKKIHGYDKNSAREKLSSLFYASASNIPYDISVIKRNVLLMNDALDLHIDDTMIENKLPILPSYKKLSFTQDDYCVFVIGASWESKIYPKERVAEICKDLPCKIYIVWGNEKEKSDAEFIMANIQNTEVTPKLNLKELSSLIAHAKLVIGNDTGPTHMAWAYNIPSITLFGPTNERMIFPTVKNIAIHSNSLVDIFHINKNDFSIKNIVPQNIINKAKELLQ
ncbi:MAG: lipopolysaccharide heptosyltransferase I [Thiovulaceae bacterium]|nr:lipopolysaccharide heptosyltransferase I [Sulfurimonadaceae bacterium]